ncbi:hypothetical protein [Paenibacillus sp. L3-i20]|uniref:hypothetical protein n=1 Tax=Paenibacillus sp. L3-i20 TaxID=2905833 RepID=UPI001EDDB60A|nr:hypothetical protein [Paenibacillus sp. L3-i20]GKU76872.1 hypothetical protein L3i20_v212690 [Paenibacillus sp. L3-i20]
MRIRKEPCRTFPLRVGDIVHDQINETLLRSVLKSKHQWIEKAILEKLERDNKAV